MTCKTCNSDREYTIQLTQKGYQGCPECTEKCEFCRGGGLYRGMRAKDFSDNFLFLPTCFECTGGIQIKDEYLDSKQIQRREESRKEQSEWLADLSAEDFQTVMEAWSEKDSGAEMVIIKLRDNVS